MIFRGADMHSKIGEEQCRQKEKIKNKDQDIEDPESFFPDFVFVTIYNLVNDGINYWDCPL